MSRGPHAWLLALVLAAAAAGFGEARAEPPAAGLDAHGQLQNPELQVRFERIAKELRCLQCQNESIADSNADLARDLRRQVREMLVEGKSDDAIFTFMTDRYGAFVLYKPPFEQRTWLLWLGPTLLLLIGVGVAVRVIMQRSKLAAEQTDTEEGESA